MHISKILIKNFKCIKELTISPNERFNVIIGENNRGKTTIFEALQTWYRCYQLFIQKNRVDFYKNGMLYFPYKDLNFLRLSKDTDLFNTSPKTASIGITIKDQNAAGVDVSFDLQFKVELPQVISNSYLRITKVDNSQFVLFASHLRANHIKLDSAIFLYQTNPISQVLSQEPFMNEGQVRKKIMRGKSQEVLRNKILLHSDKASLETRVSEVLGNEVKFEITNQNKMDKDEYINVLVENGGHSLDLHLQGSGLIQVTEIFATVDYLAAKLNILLIDEPDSHIHLALQKRLMSNIKSLSDNQSFIITHNDGFANETVNGELFYLNQDAKTAKVLNPLLDADLIKKDFGSPILTLEKLNDSNSVVFIEGDDDKVYIEKLLEKYTDQNIITNIPDLKKSFYFQTRGKDNLIMKLDHNVRSLSQLFTDKKYLVVSDKDYTPLDKSNKLNDFLKKKLGVTSEAFCHDGYCIESTLFSDLNKIHQYIAFVTSQNVAIIQSHSETIIDQILSEFKTVGSPRHIKVEVQFNSQRNNRPEISKVSLTEVIVEATQTRDTLKYLMNKGTIRDYITAMESACGVSIVPSGVGLSDIDFCTTLFLNFINGLDAHNVLYDSHKFLLSKIYGAQY